MRILSQFNPLGDVKDRKLANYLAGREIPDGELAELIASAQTNSAVAD
jgi:hypothetical protein